MPDSSPPHGPQTSQNRTDDQTNPTASDLAETSRRRYEATIRASFAAWGIVIFSVVVVAIFIRVSAGSSMSESGWTAGWIQLFDFLTLCVIWTEAGLGVFLSQTIFFNRTRGRYFAVAGTAFILLVQLDCELGSGGIMMLIYALAGLSITGWLLQRISGASLSWNDESAFQRPWGTKDMLAIAPLMLAMGIGPIARGFSFIYTPDPELSTGLGRDIIYSSLSFFVSSAVPILLCYLMFAFLRCSSGKQIVFVLIAFAIFSLCIATEIPNAHGGMPYNSLLVFGTIGCFLSGLLMGYAPFYAYGFRPAWAKRLLSPRDVDDFSFDDIDREVKSDVPLL